MNFQPAINMIKQGVKDDIFPCVAYAIGNQKQVFEKGVLGDKSLYPTKEKLYEDTLFDMASLSKLISTTMITLKAVEQGDLCLDDKLSRFFDYCYDKQDITIKKLLTHTSGLPSHIPLWKMKIEPEQAVDTILKTDFAYKTESETIYSCMGYIVLGKVLETLYGDTLDNLAKKFVFDPLDMKTACYNPETENVVSTEYSNELKGYIKGVVHDENARFLGGVSGNAGVFATIDDIIKFCTMLSCKGEGYLSNRMFDLAIQNYTKGMCENRGLGFLLSGDKPSFAGDLFSYGSYGHTGFTGTSIMVDNVTGIYAILLTNRVHFGRENDKIIRFRKQFHNSIWGNI